MFLRPLAVLLFLLSAAPALAQTDDGLPGPRECLDDNHTNRCDLQVQARVRALLGMASIEDEAASGAIVYRAFFVNGYGRDMPAIAFERRPGQSPEVVIYGREGRSTRAPVSVEAWGEVVREARFADRVLAPLPEPTDADRPAPPISICLHSWVQTVEIANGPRERFIEEPVRRRTEDACGGALTTRYAFLLADLAVEQLPWCRRLDPDTERNSITQLETCLMLSGDRVAAADLYAGRLADWRRPSAETIDYRVVRRYLGINTPHTLTWGNQVVRAAHYSDRDVADFLAARFADHPSLQFWPTSVEGLDARRVVVRGRAEIVADDSQQSADYTQTWVWNESAFTWAVSDWTVEAFAPVPPAE